MPYKFSVGIICERPQYLIFSGISLAATKVDFIPYFIAYNMYDIPALSFVQQLQLANMIPEMS